MQRILAVFLAAPALAVVTGLSGCGKEDTPKPTKPRVKLSTGDSDGTKVAAKPTIEPGKAKIVGRVVYDGDPPMSESLVAKMEGHKDKATCLAGEAFEKVDQTWMIGKDKGVANAVIWLNPPEDKDFKVVNATGEEVIDQPHCVYIPHVTVVKPGQKLMIKNSANVIHNTNLSVDPLVNTRSFGEAITAGKSAAVDWLKPQDTPIGVGCQFHAWMSAKLWVMPHQYVAKTDADGNFTIDNVPEGVELAVVAWHEGGGYFNGGKKGSKQTFKAGENKLGDLKVKAP